MRPAAAAILHQPTGPHNSKPVQADPNLTLEAKSWLVDTIASLRGVSPSTAAAAFVGSSHDAPPPLSRAAERQLLRLACEARPRDLGALLSGAAAACAVRAFTPHS